MAAGARPPAVLALISARPDGATSLAVGLAAVLSPGARTVLIDLNPERADVATLLDVDDSANVYHLAHRAQIETVRAADVEEHVRWHQGLAVLPGITNPDQGRLLDDSFVVALLDAASKAFPQVVVDLGRARPRVPPLPAGSVLLWVMTPSPLGLATFDRCFEQIMAADAPWLDGVLVVVNQMADSSLVGVAGFLNGEHGVHNLGTVPYEPDFWRALEVSSSIEPLTAQLPDDARYLRLFRRPAFRTRRALEQVLRRTGAARERQRASI